MAKGGFSAPPSSQKGPKKGVLKIFKSPSKFAPNQDKSLLHSAFFVLGNFGESQLEYSFKILWNLKLSFKNCHFYAKKV